MEAENKTFYDIAVLTKEFNEFAFQRGTEREGMLYAMVFQAQAQIAIAQQLAVISGHLGRLVALCENIKA